MDSKSFHKLKTATLISIAIQTIIGSAEFIFELLNNKYMQSDDATNDLSSRIIMNILWSSLIGSILLCAVIKEHSCMTAFAMVFQILNGLLRLGVAILAAFVPKHDHKIFYLMLRGFIAMLCFISAGFLIAFYRKIRSIRNQGYAEQSNEVGNTPQTIDLKKADLPVVA